MVKVTYRGLVFFCSCLVLFGVSRCLGYPSGGLCRWRTNERKARWPRHRVHVFGPTSTICAVRLEPPALTRLSPGWVSAGLAGRMHILLSEGSMKPCDDHRMCRLTESNVPRVGPPWLYSQQTSWTVRYR